MDAVLFDLDGVLYQTDTPIRGAAAAVRWFRKRRIPHLFLTNTTSRPRAALVEKLAAMGIAVEAEELLTPPVAAARWLQQHLRGPVALFVPEATRAEFAGLPELAAGVAQGAGAVVVGDLGSGWDFATLNRAFRLLMGEPRPVLVALGMTRYWRAEDGLRLDTGPFVTALAMASGVSPQVFGKPAAPFYEEALALLGSAAGRTLMVGDDIRGDIEGAAGAGIRTLLVRTGKFRPADLTLGIHPDAVIDSVAELPEWWAAQGSP